MPEIPPSERRQLLYRHMSNKYIISDAFKYGRHTAVYKCKQIKDLHSVVIKQNDNIQRKYMLESEIMRKVSSHPNILPIEDSLVVNDIEYIVMPWCASGSLCDFLLAEYRAAPRDWQPWSERRILCFAEQILSGLAHIHAKGFIHGDIKPDNILVTNRSPSEFHVQIIDFGLAIPFTEWYRGRYGTVGYNPYESRDGTSKAHVGQDSWAFGIVLLQLHGINVGSGCRNPKYFGPHDSWENERYYAKVREEVRDPPKDKKSLLLAKALLNENPTERYSANKALHRFFQFPTN